MHRPTLVVVGYTQAASSSSKRQVLEEEGDSHAEYADESLIMLKTAPTTERGSVSGITKLSDGSRYLSTCKC
ncbi:unnamed protein product [Amoebophrya sp. A120]|nr:unnamed protein product [Amoebophrya sp. A120]|eukprot:GSA120T00009105001.1